jgi:hypothetical protein
MLVYYSEPLGILYLENYRVYGRKWNRGPTDLPYRLYEINQKCLIDATYRGPYLRKMFGEHVSDIAFTIKELKWLPLNIIRKLGSDLGVMKRRGPRRDLRKHDMPRTSAEIAGEIIKVLQNVT